MKKIFFALVLMLIVFIIYKNNINKEVIETKPESRVVMEIAEQLVREEKPTPIQSSHFYAQIATDYYNNLDKASSSIGSQFASTTMREVLKSIITEDDKNSEGFVLNKGPKFWNLTDKWSKENKKPFSPRAEKMSTFIIDETFTYKVPTPPVYGSAEFKAALEEVKRAAERRTPEQGALVNFWGGVPGTEAPAGIWQNRLWDITKKYNLENRDYAYAQMVLAQSISDSFRECWKVKFMYQTKRPDMTDKTIPVAMPNPPFPGYVSGHSTISFTAATVLGKMFPGDKQQFINDSTTAKNSRLHAGIHFPYDNNEGENLGRAVGEFVIAKLNLKKIK